MLEHEPDQADLNNPELLLEESKSQSELVMYEEKSITMTD